IQRTIFGRGLSVRVFEIASRQHGESCANVVFWTTDVAGPVKSDAAICDQKIRLFGQRPTFFGPLFMDLCFGIEIRAAMSDEFEDQDATEKAGIRAALIRCRVLAAKIANELRNKRPEHFVDKLSLADVHASLERAADVLSRMK